MYRVSVGTMLCNHRRSFATLLDKEVCASGCISVPVPCRTIAIGRLYPTRNLQEKSSTKLRTQNGCWKRNIKYRQENTLFILLELPPPYILYKIHGRGLLLSCFCRLSCMKRRKLYENLQINTNLPRNREKNSIDGTYGHIHVKTNSHEYAQRSISVHFTAV